MRYAVQNKELTADEISAVARDFEDAVATVLVKKVQKAIETHAAKTLIVGGGVSANIHIKRCIETTLLTTHDDVICYFPQPGLSTDNSIMIALAGHARAASALTATGNTIYANGNRSL